MKNILIVYIILSIFPARSQSGIVQWGKTLGNFSEEQGFAVVADQAGNSYTIGEFHGTMDVDPGPGSFELNSGGANIRASFLLKLDRDGEFVWAIKLAGEFWFDGRPLAVDDAGNIFITGGFRVKTDFDPGPAEFELINIGSNGNADVFVVKLNKDGNFVWAISFEGSLDDFGNSVVTDNKGHLYITGFFGTIVDFDPGNKTYKLESRGMQDAFISKLDTNGNFVWARRVGAPFNEKGYSTFLDAYGNSYISGLFSGYVDFDPGDSVCYLKGVSTATHKSFFILKLNPDGHFIWARSMNGIEPHIAISPAGEVYSAGTFRLATDADPSADSFMLGSIGNEDIFISKLDSAGNFRWAIGLGDEQHDNARGIALDKYGDVYVTGTFTRFIDFDNGPGKMVLGSQDQSIDAFVLKLGSDGKFIWARQVTGAVNEISNDIFVDAELDVFVTGSFNGNINFDPANSTFSKMSAGGSDFFVYKIGAPTTGLHSTALMPYIPVYPNPSDGVFSFSMPGASSLIKIYNSSGSLVYSAYPDATHYTIDLGSFAAGLYLAEITGPGYSRQVKLIKQ